MFARRCVQGVLVLCLSTAVVGCSTSGLDSVQITPTTQSVAVGQTAQFNAVGTFGNAKHPTTQNITSSVTWSSSVPSVATINASGVATAVGPGTTTITAGGTAYNGPTSVQCNPHSYRLRRRHSGGQHRFDFCHSRFSIGCFAQSNQPIHRHRNDLVGGYAEPDQPGGLELKQHTDCHRRRDHRACHGGGSGNHHDCCPLHQLHGWYCGDRDSDVHGGGRKSRAVHGGGHHTKLSSAVGVGSNHPIDCAWHLRKHRPSDGCHQLDPDQVEFQQSVHCFRQCLRACHGFKCGQRHHHGGVNERRRQRGVRYRNRRGLQYARAGASAFAHDHSELDYGRQFTGYREFPGVRNVLGGSIRKRSDELRDLALFGARRFPGQLE